MRQSQAAELSAVFKQHGLLFAAIAKPEDLFDDPHLLATGGLAAMSLADERVTRVPLMPLTLDGERLNLQVNPSRLDEHTDALLAGVGCSREQIMAMRKVHIAKTD